MPRRQVPKAQVEKKVVRGKAGRFESTKVTSKGILDGLKAVNEEQVKTPKKTTKTKMIEPISLEDKKARTFMLCLKQTKELFELLSQRKMIRFTADYSEIVRDAIDEYYKKHKEG